MKLTADQIHHLKQALAAEKSTLPHFGNTGTRLSLFRRGLLHGALTGPVARLTEEGLRVARQLAQELAK
jgi:hypothetical protein